MLKKIGIVAVMLLAACLQTEDAPDETSAAQESIVQQQPGGKAEACALARDLGLGETALQSCLAGSPISSRGVLAPLPTRPAATQACNTYYGTCSGVNGCSRAVGEGWELTNCGSFLYSWMTICNGQPSGWGVGFCLF